MQVSELGQMMYGYDRDSDSTKKPQTIPNVEEILNHFISTELKV